METINNFKKDAKEFLNGFKQMKQDLTTKGKRIKQIPNLITLSRLGIACFIPPALLSGNLVLAGALSIVAGLTDAVDGKVARKLDATSEFGKNLDPVCDKIFVATLIAPLVSILPTIPTIGLGINLALEGTIAGINLKSKAKGNNPKSTWPGKIKTALLFALLAAFYVSFNYDFNALFIPTLYASALTAQTVACVDYYRIDKKKDKKSIKINNETNIQPQSQNELTETNTKDKNLKNPTTTYTIEDYKKLRDEITVPTETNENSLDNGFQKTIK